MIAMEEAGFEPCTHSFPVGSTHWGEEFDHGSPTPFAQSAATRSASAKGAALSESECVGEQERYDAQHRDDGPERTDNHQFAHSERDGPAES